MGKLGGASQLFPRRIFDTITEYTSGFRVVPVNGARQSGKSTLIGQLHERRGGTLTTLDDREVLRAARTDPQGFVSAYPFPLYIDEIQRGGDQVVLAIKASVDRNPADFGRFVIAGSSRFLTSPNLEESLAGRLGIIDLWPLSQSELVDSTDSLIDLLFEPGSELRSVTAPRASRQSVAEQIVTGGFPGVIALGTPKLKRAWFESYLRTLIDRDLAEFRRPSRTLDVNRLVRLILSRTAQEINASSIAGLLQITATTVRSTWP